MKYAKQIFKTENGCDSVSVLNLLVNESLFVDFDSTVWVCEDDENLVIAPADGHIVVSEPTEEWEYFLTEDSEKAEDNGSSTPTVKGTQFVTEDGNGFVTEDGNPIITEDS